jgi:hypothetical protein
VNTEVALIVGNGTSRMPLDLLKMMETLGDNRPAVYGCNALYREFAPDYQLPDYLAAIDDGVIAEISKSDFPLSRLIVPPPEERWEPLELHPGLHRPRSNAGMVAMAEAIRRGATALLCVGFDSFLKDAEQSLSNMFDGTDNYGPETRAKVWDNPGRVRFMSWFARQHPDVSFIFVYPKGLDAVPIGETNVYQTTYEDLLEWAE